MHEDGDCDCPCGCNMDECTDEDCDGECDLCHCWGLGCECVEEN